MDDKRVTAEEIKELLAADLDVLAEKMAAAMNAARDGSIISDSELPVWQAHGEFRKQAYEKALRLLQARQEAFSPSAQADAVQGGQADPARDDQRLGAD